MSSPKQLVQQGLLFLALAGVCISLLWDYVVPEAAFSSTGKSCPVGKSTLMSTLEKLNDVSPSQASCPPRNHICETCIVVNNRIYDAGDLRSNFPDAPMSLSGLSGVLADGRRSVGGASDHAMVAGEELLKRKLQCVGRLEVEDV